VGAGDTLFAWVYLDSAAPPSTVFLQWGRSGYWEHRAYWGANLVPWGTDGTASRRSMGALPPVGEWVRLEVPAALVAVEGQSVDGIAFSVVDGAASWDDAGIDRSAGGTFTWIDDAPPAGGALLGTNEGWFWTGADPPVFSGRVAHHSSASSGLHQHLYENPTVPVAVGADDLLYADVFLPAEGAPRQVMVQWKAGGNWEHRAYWGEDLIVAGTNGTASRYPMGGLPPVGQWVRLAVPASAVGVANQVVGGMSFTLFDGRAVWDTAGVLPAEEEFVWVDDAVPAGAVPMPENDGWIWVSSDPAPVVGALAHQSPIRAGLHSHYFHGASRTLPVNAGDVLFGWVYLDPANPPRSLMFQWRAAGSWDHRAYWGEDLLNWGVRTRIGDLPPAGQWVRLEIPAEDVGLAGKAVDGMSFVLYDGRATYDAAGVVRASPQGP
jgi:hypothetical protein